MSDDTCNGWVNRETWAVAVNVGNIPDAYREVSAWAGQVVRHRGVRVPAGPAVAAVADGLRVWVEDMRDETFRPGGGSLDWQRQLVREAGSLWRVDWHAIARGYVEDAAGDIGVELV